MFTIPINYNPYLDKLISNKKIKMTKTYFLKRIKKDIWKQVDLNEELKSKYGKPFAYDNCVMIGEIEN